MAGVGLPAAAVRAQLGSAVDLIAHLERSADGARRVVEVAEVDLSEAGDAVVRVVARGDAMVAPRRVAGRRPVPAADAGGPR
jgi:pilus assembly protein CpaF